MWDITVYYFLCSGEHIRYARVAQLVERDLAKVEAAGSSPVSRSQKGHPNGCPFFVPEDGRVSKRDRTRTAFEVSAPLRSSLNRGPPDL